MAQASIKLCFLGFLMLLVGDMNTDAMQMMDEHGCRTAVLHLMCPPGRYISLTRMMSTFRIMCYSSLIDDSCTTILDANYREYNDIIDRCQLLNQCRYTVANVAIGRSCGPMIGFGLSWNYTNYLTLSYDCLTLHDFLPPTVIPEETTPPPPTIQIIPQTLPTKAPPTPAPTRPTTVAHVEPTRPKFNLTALAIPVWIPTLINTVPPPSTAAPTTTAIVTTPPTTTTIAPPVVTVLFHRPGVGPTNTALTPALTPAQVPNPSAQNPPPSTPAPPAYASTASPPINRPINPLINPLIPNQQGPIQPNPAQSVPTGHQPGLNTWPNATPPPFGMPAGPGTPPHVVPPGVAPPVPPTSPQALPPRRPPGQLPPWPPVPPRNPDPPPFHPPPQNTPPQPTFPRQPTVPLAPRPTPPTIPPHRHATPPPRPAATPPKFPAQPGWEPAAIEPKIMETMPPTTTEKATAATPPPAPLPTHPPVILTDEELLDPPIAMEPPTQAVDPSIKGDTGAREQASNEADDGGIFGNSSTMVAVVIGAVALLLAVIGLVLFVSCRKRAPPPPPEKSGPVPYDPDTVYNLPPLEPFKRLRPDPASQSVVSAGSSVAVENTSAMVMAAPPHADSPPCPPGHTSATRPLLNNAQIYGQRNLGQPPLPPIPGQPYPPMHAQSQPLQMSDNYQTLFPQDENVYAAAFNATSLPPQPPPPGTIPQGAMAHASMVSPPPMSPLYHTTMDAANLPPLPFDDGYTQTQKRKGNESKPFEYIYGSCLNEGFQDMPAPASVPAGADPSDYGRFFLNPYSPVEQGKIWENPSAAQYGEGVYGTTSAYQPTGSVLTGQARSGLKY